MAGKQPQRIVVEDADALTEAAARRVTERLVSANGVGAFCLTGGSSPQGLYRLLATQAYRARLAWDRIHFFWGDDRFVPHDDPRSNFGAAKRLLLDHVPVPPRNVHGIPIGTASVDAAADLYEHDLRRFYDAERQNLGRPLFDVVLMGVGEDGHTASLFPGQRQLEERSRWVVGVREAGLEPFVPRVSLTFPALASSCEMLFLVSGPGKRVIMGRVFAGEDLPATQAYSEGQSVWLLDRAAAPERYRG